MLATSRLFFAYALGTALLIPLHAGACTHLTPSWPEPASVAATMSSFRPTLLFSVPTFFGRMLRADLPPDTFRSLRAAVSAGERLPAELYHAYRERFGVEILDGMGATETVFMVLSNRPGQSRAGSSGTPVPSEKLEWPCTSPQKTRGASAAYVSPPSQWSNAHHAPPPASPSPRR